MCHDLLASLTSTANPLNSIRCCYFSGPDRMKQDADNSLCSCDCCFMTKIEDAAVGAAILESDLIIFVVLLKRLCPKHIYLF